MYDSEIRGGWAGWGTINRYFPPYFDAGLAVCLYFTNHPCASGEGGIRLQSGRARADGTEVSPGETGWKNQQLYQIQW